MTIDETGVGEIEVTVTNANTEAPWDMYANCTEGFSQRGSPYRMIGNHTISIPITCSGMITGTCEVIVYDANNPDYRDSIVVDMECLQQDPLICTPGETRCNGNLIDVCVGSGWEMTNICEENCIYRNGEPICIEDEPGPDMVYLMSVAVIVIIVLLIVVLVIKRKNLR